MNLKKQLFLVLILLTINIHAADLIITGVIDGPLSGGVPKAVELYAINDISDLSAYGIGSANNGGGSDGEEYSFPSVTISAGNYIYVASESDGFNTFFGFKPRYIDNAANINGDDAIELFYNGNVIDVFGDINVDGTGADWEYLDGWAYRKSNTEVDGSTFNIANWKFSGPNALDGESTNATASTPFPIGTYTFNSNSTTPSIKNITQTPEDVTSSDKVNISAEITDDGSIAKAILYWSTSTTVYSDSITMISENDSIFVTENPIPAHSHGTTIYYKVDAQDNDSEKTSSVDFQYTVLDYELEPSNHITHFVATKIGTDKIILSWHENNGTVAPAGYLIKASTSEDITSPTDGTPVTENSNIGDNEGAVNVPNGRISYEWTGLEPETTYFFKIYPYTNSGENIDYKTDATIPASENTTNASTLIETYYTGISDLSGETLKTALNDLISDHTTFPYTDGETDVWDILKITDKDTVNPNNVILIYSGQSVDAAQEYNNGAGWTREHVWAKSRGDFSTEEGPGTDTHQLRPCNSSVNSSKGNKDFDNGGNTHSIATECTYTDTTWEVRDIAKGDIARMMFYMATRYEGENDEPDLQLIDYIQDLYSKDPFHGKLSTLLEWHKQDPVDEYEMRRNEVVYSFQGNRNPFIDHPEFVSLIWKDNSDAIEDISQTITKFDLGHAYPNPFNPSTTITYQIPKNCFVTINIYNLRGNLVNNLVKDTQSAGNYEIVWNGRDRNNQQVSTGVYFYQMITNAGFSKTAKVVFMK